MDISIYKLKTKFQNLLMPICEKLVKLKPEEIETRAFLGYLYYENEELDKAEENLNKALDVSTEDEQRIDKKLKKIQKKSSKKWWQFWR